MTARLGPVPREQWTAEAEAAIRAGMPSAAADRFLAPEPDALRLTNGIASMLHHPRLAERFLAFNGQLLWEPALEPRLRELMVLRVAYRTRSPYEWVQHVKLSQRYDVTADEVAAITSHDYRGFSPLESDLLNATDQLLDDYRIDDATWARLAGALDEKTLLEVVFVVGTYTALAMVFNGIGIELDPDLDPASAPALPEE